MASEKIIFIKIPVDMSQAQVNELAEILKRSFKGTPYGFFIVPDRFDVLSKVEVEEFLDTAVKYIKADEK